MKTTFTLCYFFVFSIGLFAQTNFWQRVDLPYGTRCVQVVQYPDGRIVTNNNRTSYSKRDGDQRWTREERPFEWVYSFETSPGSAVFARGDKYFHRSLDLGKTWDSPYQPDKEWSAVFVNKETGDVLGFQKGDTIFRSTDYGVTWQSIIPPFTNVVAMGYGINNEFSCGGKLNKDEPGTYFISSDNGATWTHDSTYKFTTNIKKQARYSPTSSVIVGRRNELYATTDNGKNWNRVVTFVDPPFDQEIYSVGYCGGNVIVGKESGVALVDTLTWTIRDPQIQIPYALSLHTTANGMTYAGTDHGVFTSTDCGQTWGPDNIGTNPGVVIWIGSINGEGVLVSLQDKYLVGTSDNGNTWRVVLDGGLVSGNCVFCLDGVYAIRASDQELVKSSDGMRTWNRVFFSDKKVTTIYCRSGRRLYLYGGELNCFSYLDGNQTAPTYIPETSVINFPYQWAGESVVTEHDVILLNRTSFLSRFDPDSLTWRDLKPDASMGFGYGLGLHVARLSVDSNDRIYALLWQEVGTKSYIYLSTDQGLIWKKVDSAVTTNPYFNKRPALVVDKRDHVYYILSDGVIRVSTDFGNTWGVLNSPTPSVQYGFHFSAIDEEGHFWAAATTEGLFRSSRPLAVEPTPPVAATSSLSIYPNPAVSTSTVTASITLDEINTGALTLEVVNELGAVMYTQQLQSEGRKQITANVPVHALSNGYYVMRVTGQGRAMQQGVVVFRK